MKLLKNLVGYFADYFIYYRYVLGLTILPADARKILVFVNNEMNKHKKSGYNNVTIVVEAKSEENQTPVMEFPEDSNNHKLIH